ncbi:myeloid-associated differentiation marker homolog [Symphorus nematophorus]
MPVIVLEARDFTSPLFLVRTWEVLCACTTFSLVASLDPSELNKNSSNLEHLNKFRIFCMFTWCFFFTLTLLIHILSVIQFHSLIPISWKNLTITVAVLGALMCFSASVIFPWIIMGHHGLSSHSVAAAVSACLTTLAYTSESYVLCTQAHEQRGYMGSMPGLLKILQLWGGCQMIPLVVALVCGPPSGVHTWQLWVSGVSYGVCILMSLVTPVVILGDFAGRCLLPFDKFLAGFSLIGVLLYMVATVICFTKILQLRELGPQTILIKSAELVIMETVVASITLLAYTVDLAFAIKLLCDRSHA